jgi:hypothetical protein
MHEVLEQTLPDVGYSNFEAHFVAHSHGKAFHGGGRAENEGGNRRGHDCPRRENEAEGGVEKRLAYSRLQGLGSQDRESEPDSGDTPAIQPDSKGLAAFFQSPLQRAERPAELLGRFIAGQTARIER